MSTLQTVEEVQTKLEPERVVNDFSLTVATVNGSGSQTSNLTLLRLDLVTFPIQDGDPCIREKFISLEHPGSSHLVYHPGEQGWLSGQA